MRWAPFRRAKPPGFRRVKPAECVTPTERRARERRYFAFCRGFQAGASALPQRIAPYPDYDEGFQLGRRVAGDAFAQWLAEHGIEEPSYHPYLCTEDQNVPEDADRTRVSSEPECLGLEMELGLDDFDIDVTAFEAPTFEAPKIDGLIGDDGEINYALHGFPLIDLDV